MSWNGAGTYVLNPSFSPEVAGTTIDPTRYNGLTTDIAGGITAALAKNGENVPTANLPMGGFKHTGAVGATGAGQYLSYNQTGAVLADLTVTSLTVTNLTWSGLAAGVAAYLVSPGPIGGTTPNTGAFSTLSSSGAATLNSLTVSTTSLFTGVATFTATPTGTGLAARFSTPGPIGNTSASTGAFTTLTATTLAGDGAALTNLAAAALTGNIAAARMASAFATTLGNDGTVTLPGGWIIKTGTTAHGSANPASATETFAVQFPTAVVSVIACCSNGVNMVGVGTPSATAVTFTIYNRDSGSNAVAGNIHWIALGN